MSNAVISSVRLGASLSFDGTSASGVKVPVVSAVTNNFSMGVWAKITVPSSTIYTLMSNGINDTISAFNGFALQVANGQFRLNFNGVTSVNTGIAAPAGVWFHAAIVRASGTMHLYVNGQDTGFTTTQTPTTPTGFTTLAGTIDAAGGTYYRNYVGLLAGAFFCARALSPAEITQLYQGKTVSQAGNLLWWPLNEGGGSVAKDNGPSGNNGMITDAVFVRDAPLGPTAARTVFARAVAAQDAGRSLGLRGGSTFDNVTIPGLVPGASFSFALWFKMCSTASFQRLVSWRASGAGGFELEENGTTNKLTFAGSNASGTTVINLAPTATFTIGAWAHVAITCTANNTVMYLNGVAVASDTTHTLAAATGQTLTIGKASFTNGTSFIGLVDQFVFANNTLWSAAAVAALYSAGTLPPNPNVLLNFDERSGSVAVDASGNGNNGVINGPTSAFLRFPDAPPFQPSYGRPGMYP